MEANRALWLKIQYPENWFAKVAPDALRKIIQGKGKPLDSARSLSVQSTKDVKPPMLMVKYRGNQSQFCAGRLQNLINVQVVFTTRKLESCLPSLKSTFSNASVVFKLSSGGFTSIDVGQTVRLLTTCNLKQCSLEGNSADLS